MNPEKFQSPEEALESTVEELYSDKLPYHNFDHARAVVDEALAIVRKCQSEGVEINGEVVRLAALFHDAGYHLDHEKEGYDSKEELSASLAQENLLKFGFSQDVVDQVVQAILATHRDKQFVTNEQKALRAADLAGLAKDYDSFLQNTVLLKREHEMLHGESISWDDWKTNSKRLIEFYLSQDIRLTSEYEDEEGSSRFHVKAKEILQKFLETPISELERLESEIKN